MDESVHFWPGQWVLWCKPETLPTQEARDLLRSYRQEYGEGPFFIERIERIEWTTNTGDELAFGPHPQRLFVRIKKEWEPLEFSAKLFEPESNPTLH